MNTIPALLAIFLLCSCRSGPIPEEFAGRLADAIYHAEGGAKARVPYGILSVKVRDAAHARRVCLTTVRNNWLRWETAGKTGAFVDFLADRYCPPSADPAGNRNWKRNVRFFLTQPKEMK